MTIFILMIGVLASGFAVIFVKIGTLDPIVLAAYRQLLSGLLLLPLFFRDLKKSGEPFRPARLVPSLLPGVFLGLHFIGWIMGARIIPGGHASVIATMTPVVMPFLMFVLIREKITPMEVLGSLAALGGALFLALKDGAAARGYLKGDLLVFCSMLLYTLYLALARKNRKHAPLWFYMVPLYFAGGLLCLMVALFRGADLLPRSPEDWLAVGGLSLVCTIVGHSIGNYGMRKLRGQLVSLLNLTQILFATLSSFLLLGEVPPLYFYPAGLCILSGPLLVILFDKRRSSAP